MLVASSFDTYNIKSLKSQFVMITYTGQAQLPDNENGPVLKLVPEKG